MKEDSIVPVVGIGASAGGLTALKHLFEALPQNPGAAFVVIVHLDPYHASELAEILAKHTPMRVVQVNERMPLEADTVYVIPPDRQLSLEDGQIAEAAFETPRGQRAPINTFFRTLAAHRAECYAVVLSGGGGDGAMGVRAIKEKGGFILVQDPAEAEFASMPRSALASGADFVLPVRALASKLATLLQDRPHLEGAAGIERDDALGQILGLIRMRTGQDFSQYKRATIVRRVARRMQVARADSLADYLTYLREQPTEAQALFNDLLISVTSFFRDAKAFERLNALVIPEIFEQAGAQGAIRVWVPACATGEEAYSIAMLLLDEAARRKFDNDVQVFASDLDGEGLAVAREGRYPLAIAADVSDEHLVRYFIKESQHYRVKRELRDRVVFALHSIIKDPPFSRVDLISCRNLLIYLDRDVQAQTSSVFHYALRPGGFLFVGASEHADNPAGLFSVVDREARIYRRTDRPRDRLPPVPLSLTADRQVIASGGRRFERPPPADGSVHSQALELNAPPSMLVDAAHRVVNLSESAGRYLLLPAGSLTSDATELVRPELKAELLAALHAALERKERSLSLPVPVRFNGAHQTVIVQVSPVTREGSSDAALILFIEGGAAHNEPAEPGAGPLNSREELLRRELASTRSQLRTTREQYEGAIEEVRAANEELQSINEEYRSTAEELETSKEELQSINEELQTVNAELKTKLDLVSRAHSDLQNLITATDVGTLFLDSTLHIRLFTPRVTNIFNIAVGDEGRSVTDFTHQLDYADIVADSRRVLSDLVPIEHTVHADGDRWFLVRLRPYRSIDDRIEGVVLTFIDITERRQSDITWEARQTMLLGELSHRVKNSLAVVQAVTRLTLKDAGTSSETMTVLEGRLQAMSKAHELLVQNSWKGANLETLAREQLGPYLDDGAERLHMKGMPTILPSSLATPVGLLLHELATNAAKHGAWREPHGQVHLSWMHREGPGGPWLDLEWREQGGPPPRPARQGAGTRLITNCIAGSRVRQDFPPEGAQLRIEVPLRHASDAELP